MLFILKYLKSSARSVSVRDYLPNFAAALGKRKQHTRLISPKQSTESKLKPHTEPAILIAGMTVGFRLINVDFFMYIDLREDGSSCFRPVWNMG